MESKKLFEVYCTGECGEEFDEVFTISEGLKEFLAKVKCPKCGAELKQKMTFGAGRFRGSGFTRRSC